MRTGAGKISPQRTRWTRRRTQRFVWFQLVDHSLDAGLEVPDVEVDEQANVAAGELEIRKQLSLVDWLDPADCFQLHNNFPFDQQVDSIPSVEPYAFVHDGKALLALDR